MKDLHIGIGVTGSFCCFSQVIPVMERLTRDNHVTAVLSPAAFTVDTRFYKAEDFRADVGRLCQGGVMHTIAQAEEVGPKKLFDVMLIAPCTGNTLAKLNYGITDTTVLMAAKAHLRNGRPLVLAIATNDALAAAAVNIGGLLNKKNIYFVPFSQDDHIKKPRSMVARFGLCEKAMEKALEGEQVQPIIV